jgi:hypothetical protein
VGRAGGRNGPGVFFSTTVIAGRRRDASAFARLLGLGAG